MTRFNVRIEYPDRHYADTHIHAESSLDVPFQFHRRQGYDGAQWCGLVVFVDGAKKAEDMVKIS